MIRAGTLPARKPGTLICEPIVLYAASRLGLSSSNGTSTVSLTRVGLRVSTALFTTWHSRIVGKTDIARLGNQAEAPAHAIGWAAVLRTAAMWRAVRPWDHGEAKRSLSRTLGRSRGLFSMFPLDDVPCLT